MIKYKEMKHKKINIKKYGIENLYWIKYKNIYYKIIK